MSLPGQTVEVVDAAASGDASTDTTTWFIAGSAEKGSAGPHLIKSIAGLKSALGDRLTYSFLYDAVDAILREWQGAKIYIARVFGPDAEAATVTLADGADPCVTGTFQQVGQDGNGYTVTVVGTTTISVTVKDPDGVTVETHTGLTTKAALIAAFAASDVIRFASAGIGALPDAVADAPLAGGDDDHAAAGDDERAEALALFAKDLGPGKVSLPGVTTAAAFDQLATHALENNRVAFVDLPNSASAQDLIDVVDDMVAEPEAQRRCAPFVPWGIMPGVTADTTRTVPYSPIQAGLCGRLEGLGNTPNVPAAGVNGISQCLVDLAQPAWSDDDRELLNDRGINVARVINGSVRTYGYRTLADPEVDANWVELSNVLLAMAIQAKAEIIAERFVFAQIDGRGHKLGQFAGELSAMLSSYWQADALFGDTAPEAFVVDVGSNVNTPETLADRELRAVLKCRMSPFAERVHIDIVKVANTEVLA